MTQPVRAFAILEGTRPRSAAPAPASGDPVYPAASLGVDAEALSRIRDRFFEQQRRGDFAGGQLAIRRDGRLVLSEAAGWARSPRSDDPYPPLRATPDTLFPVFSAGKPLVAMAIARLEEMGQLEVNAPVARYFPGFENHGKDTITVLDVLTHRGGMWMPGFCARPEEWPEWDRVVQALCDARPTLRRGVLAYHPLEYGWVLGELVRRLSGRTLPAFLAEEFLGPAGLANLRFQLREDDLPSIARVDWLGGPVCHIGPTNVAPLFTRVFTMPRVLTALVPGAGLVASARSLTAFYDVLLSGGVATNGRRVVNESTVRTYTARHHLGFCRSNRAPLAVGRGFLLGTLGPNAYGLWGSQACFGHPGAFCTVAFADPTTGLSVAIVTNGNRGPRDVIRRFVGLSHCIRRSVRR